MSGPQLPPGVGFALTVPPSWLEIDVAPETRASSLEALVEQQVRDVPELREHRTALGRLLREQAEQAWAAGSSYCASMIEPTEDGPVVASAVVLVVPAPVGVASGSVLEAVAAPLVPRARKAADEPWREVERVEIPGADGAVRAFGLEDVELPDGAGVVRTVTMQTLVPLPAQRVLLLTCSSPVVDLAEDLLDLFDAISGTLEVVEAPVAEVAG